MSLGQKKLAEEVRSASTINITYAVIGVPFEHPARQIFIQNLTNQPVMVSFDGSTDHLPLASNGFYLDDTASNRQATADQLNWPKGSQWWVKTLPGGSDPTTGSVWLSVFYAKGE